MQLFSAAIFQVVDEALIFARLGVLIGQPQQIGRMHRHQRLDALVKIDQTAAVLVDRRDLAEHALRRGRAHRHHQLGFDRGELALVPWAACLDLRRGRLLVQAEFSARHEFEMLHRVGDVDLGAVDAGFFQRAVEHLPGRSHERMPARSSLSPGCSPTSMIRACCGPSPNTVCVAFFQSGQARQEAASSRKASMIVGRLAVLRCHRAPTVSGACAARSLRARSSRRSCARHPRSGV